ncbi:MAG TPA: aldo/keto reductase [Acidimicrobiales bacterium]|nr:aldo/keto reductase [Acidimicrobiales bacterium]
MDLSITSTIELRNGTAMPRLGLGVYQVPSGAQTEIAVTWALADGYRHVDTARIYGNEASVGTAIRDSGVPRDEVWVTTKLWPTDLNVQRAFDRSLGRLGLDYVDLYLVHFPFPGRIRATWRSMEAIAATGLARAIGVSNFTRRQLEGLLRHASVPPSVNQVRASVFGYSKPVYELCQREHVAFEAYSPLHRGKGLDHPTLASVAARHSKSPAQVLLRWGLQKNMVVIPKSVREARIAQNAELYDFVLSEEDMVALDALSS